MDQLEHWSTLYNLSRQTIAELREVRREKFRVIGCVAAGKILAKNSELFSCLLKDLPPPRKKAHPGILVDFLFPSREGWDYFFRGRASPMVSFPTEDKATSIFNKAGVELYCGGTVHDGEMPVTRLSTYVRVAGYWEQGYRQVIDSFLPFLLSNDYFILRAGLGRLTPPDVSLEKLSHQLVTPGEMLLSYSYAPQRYYLSAHLDYVELNKSWTKRDGPALEERIRDLNGQFFQRGG